MDDKEKKSFPKVKAGDVFYNVEIALEGLLEKFKVVGASGGVVEYEHESLGEISASEPDFFDNFIQFEGARELAIDALMKKIALMEENLSQTKEQLRQLVEGEIKNRS